MAANCALLVVMNNHGADENSKVPDDVRQKRIKEERAKVEAVLKRQFPELSTPTPPEEYQREWTPAENERAKQIEAAARQRDKYFRATKPLEDVIGSGRDKGVLWEVINALRSRETYERSGNPRVNDVAINRLTRILPDVPPEKLKGLFKFKVADLYTMEPPRANSPN
jgi:hypothetical protein